MVCLIKIFGFEVLDVVLTVTLQLSKYYSKQEQECFLSDKARTTSALNGFKHEHNKRQHISILQGYFDQFYLQ